VSGYGRGVCSVCGKDTALTKTGGCRAHDDCAGGGQPPELTKPCGCRLGAGFTEDCPQCRPAAPAPQTDADGFLMGGGSKAPGSDSDADDWLMDAGVDDAEERLYMDRRKQRYRMPDPLTGIPKAWTRCTTFAETVSDLFSLNLWRLRMATIGYVRYPDLLEDFRELDYVDAKDHKSDLDKAASRAQWLAGSKVPASWGTAMHSQVEKWSREEISIDEADPVYRDELAAYAAAMQEWDLSPVPSLIERRICVPLYGVAGTLDQAVKIHRSRHLRVFGRTVKLTAGEHVIGDVKSGKNLDYAFGEIAIQMAMYAHGLKEGRVLVWDPDGHDPKYDSPGAWVWEKIGIPVDSVRTDVGVVMHIPVDRPEGEPAKCTLYWLDLKAGWEAAQLCEAVRDWRKAKALAQPVSVSEISVSHRPVVRDASWDERFSSVQSKDQARQLYREYVAEHGKGSEAGRLVALAKKHLRSLIEESA
jgi:hypothetical protein